MWKHVFAVLCAIHLTLFFSSLLKEPPAQLQAHHPIIVPWFISVMTLLQVCSHCHKTQPAAQMGLLHFLSVSHTTSLCSSQHNLEMPLVGRETVMFSDSQRLFWSKKCPRVISVTHTHTCTHTYTLAEHSLSSPSSPLFQLSEKQKANCVTGVGWAAPTTA